MFQYIIKRILIFIPTFFIISLLIFGLSKMAAGDPVLVALKGNGSSDMSQRADLMAGEKAYALKAEELGLDKPTFYFTLTSAAYPRDLYTIQKAYHRQLISRLIDHYGNQDLIMDYYNQIKDLQYKVTDLVDADYDTRLTIRKYINDLFLDYDDNGITYKLEAGHDALVADTSSMKTILSDWKSLTAAYEAIKNNPTTHKLYIPDLNWYGFDNQYHTWMFGDYPWFSTVDSSKYHEIAAISDQIKAMRPEESTFSRKISTIKGNNYKIKKQINAENTTIDVVDSLKSLLGANEAKIENLVSERSIISDKIKTLFDKRDQLSASLERYASKGFLRGDFGISYSDSKKVSHRINEALYWTVVMNIIAIFLAYLISIPLGVNSVLWKRKGRKLIDNINTTVLFVLYSVPNFWIGTLLLIFFTTSEYGEWLDLFPSSGAQNLELRDDPNASWLTKLLDVAHHLVLPVFCITYGSLAYLSRQMRGAVLGVVQQDYIRTARAKGLSERRVIWKHAFRNSLFPIITLFGSVFPRALSGAIAIEMIYAIPGMGYLLLMSITARDWPVVFAIVMLIAVMAMIGNLIADILYAMVDPRVTY